jgi:flagellar P-ring protein precursor FlgI
MGGSVRISPIAISQNGLNIQVKLPNANQQSEQGALTEGEVLAAGVFMLKGGADLKDIVNGFNKIGASSRDLIEVLKAVKTAGALHAKLVIR